ncbi:HlyD family efflux transporter periplasmic adaptor subunit [Neorhodopirellula pilleata]|uniref:Multidrug resistance protein MdtN n=1 Tax=Neorhodopirellula pilleata TaxID=2714738 RepID=A0A5C6A4G5_9BACT|nr:HlyD family efflux transporter periplasmic adaptor subunit [Neorhodopirellula pilleata]TWT94285.1 Multidrug resistance protein MdtN [Neorhodopirellula pilleata]
MADRTYMSLPIFLTLLLQRSASDSESGGGVRGGLGRLSARCLWLGIAVSGFGMILGCDRIPLFSDDSTYRSASPGAGHDPVDESSQPSGGFAGKIVAQGTLQPQTGVLRLMAPPGDRVIRIAVNEGEIVEPGDLLVELESARAKQVELDVAQTKLDEGKQRLAAEASAAQARLQVARAKLRQSEAELQQAQTKLRIAEGEGGELDLLRRAADLAQRKLDRLRDAANDPSTRRLVSDDQLEEEGLKIEESRAGYESAKADAKDAIAAGRLAVEAAEQEIIAAERAIEAAAATGSIGSLEKQIELLKLSLEMAKLKSPIRGRVLSIDSMVGQATTTMPLMHLADTTEMICIAEINVADLNRVEPGQTAIITSPGLVQPLTGTVQKIHPMIAAPGLSNPFPMAPVDRYTGEATIKIEPESVPFAAQRIEMQVEVVIRIEPTQYEMIDSPALP